jgi:hypothetical protein
LSSLFLRIYSPTDALPPRQAYPIVYRSTYNFDLSAFGLVFLAPFLSNVLGVLLYFGFFNPRYTVREARVHASNPTATIPPEARLPGVIVAACLVPIGMF